MFFVPLFVLRSWLGNFNFVVDTLSPTVGIDTPELFVFGPAQMVG